MTLLAWVLIGYFSVLFVGLAVMWSLVLRRQRSGLSPNARLFVVARIVELLLSALLVALAIAIGSLLPFVGLVVLFVSMTILRRSLRKREATTRRVY